MKVMPSSPCTVKICLAPYDGLTPSMYFLYLEVQKKGIHWTEVTEVINWTRAIVFHIYWVYYIEDIMLCIHTYIHTDTSGLLKHKLSLHVKFIQPVCIEQCLSVRYCLEKKRCTYIAC